MTRMGPTVMRNTLASLLLQLEDDAVELLLLQAQRLARGRAQYGELHIDRDGRNWLDEAIAEYLDGSNYLAIELIRRSRGR